MCYCCLESQYIFKYIHEEKILGKARYNEHSAVLFLQESDHILDIMDTMRAQNTLDPLTIFCRYLDLSFADYSEQLFATLNAYFANDELLRFAKKTNNPGSPVISKFLRDGSVYSSKPSWDRLNTQKKQCIKESRKILNEYISWWIQMEKIQHAKAPYSDSPARQEYKNFLALLPVLFFSMNYLIQHGRGADIIQKIALTKNWHTLPDKFTLWLQRKAFLACVKRDGISFVAQHYDKIRFELIFYAFLQRAFREEEVLTLKNILKNGSRHGSDHMLRDDFLAFIDTGDPSVVWAIDE